MLRANHCWLSDIKVAWVALCSTQGAMRMSEWVSEWVLLRLTASLLNFRLHLVCHFMFVKTWVRTRSIPSHSPRSIISSAEPEKDKVQCANISPPDGVNPKTSSTGVHCLFDVNVCKQYRYYQSTAYLHLHLRLVKSVKIVRLIPPTVEIWIKVIQWDIKKEIRIYVGAGLLTSQGQ